MLAAIRKEKRIDYIHLDTLEYEDHQDTILEGLSAPYFAIIKSKCLGRDVYTSFRPRGQRLPNTSNFTLPNDSFLITHSGTIKQLTTILHQVNQRPDHFTPLAQLMLANEYTQNSLQESINCGSWICDQQFTKRLNKYRYIITLRWSINAVHITIQRKTGQPNPSNRKVINTNHRLGINPAPESIFTLIDSTITKNYEEKSKLQFLQFRDQLYENVGNAGNLGLKINSQISKAIYIGPVSMREDRLYKDVNKPDTECWFLLECSTHSGHSISMIVNDDVTEFHPVRFICGNKDAISKGKAAVAYLLDPQQQRQQLSNSVKLNQMSPIDQGLIIETIKRALCTQ